jgi:hypothetical protein
MSAHFPFKTTINFFSVATVYMFDFVFPSASPPFCFFSVSWSQQTNLISFLFRRAHVPTGAALRVSILGTEALMCRERLCRQRSRVIDQTIL